METSRLVAPDSPFFDGHFPGAPVLPGVVQLGMVLELLGDARLAAVEHLRLRHTVHPGDRLDFVVERRGDRVEFTIRRDGRRVANGTLRVA